MRVETQVLGGEGKKLHLFHWVIGEATGVLHATGEHMLLHVSQSKSSPPPAHVAEKLARYTAAHAHLPEPEGAGRAIGAKVVK